MLHEALLMDKPTDIIPDILRGVLGEGFDYRPATVLEGQGQPGGRRRGGYGRPCNHEGHCYPGAGGDRCIAIVENTATLVLPVGRRHDKVNSPRFHPTRGHRLSAGRKIDPGYSIVGVVPRMK